MLADLTDDDGALAEMADLESLDKWLSKLDQQMLPEEPPPYGEFLLDDVSREKLPHLYSGEDVGMDAQAQVKFFTPIAIGPGTPVSLTMMIFSLGWYLDLKLSWDIFL